MEPDAVRSLIDAPGPFVSLVIDDSHDTHDAVEQAQARWAGIRRQLEERGVAGEVLLDLQRAVLHDVPVVGRKGRLVIAGRDGVIVSEQLDDPPTAPMVRVSEFPYLVPLGELATAHPAYVFASVDHLGATVRVHDGQTVRTETVEGPGYPVHKPAAAGWHGYGDVERSAEEAVRMNVRAVADRIVERANTAGAELVFVSGEVRARTDLESAMTGHIGARVVSLPAGAHGRRATEAELADLITAEFAHHRRATTRAVMDRFEAEGARGTGLAVQGLHPVCAALRDGAVETLIIGGLGGATVVSGTDRTTIAPDADSLSDFGEPPCRIAPADEVLPFVAVTTGATVLRADDAVTLTDGVAALLRYPVVAPARPGRPLPRGRPLSSEVTEMSDERESGHPGACVDVPIEVQTGSVTVAGTLTVPHRPCGAVIFAHGSGSSRHSVRNRCVATVLNDAGFATVLFDLLTPAEEADRTNVFDIGLLAGRLVDVTVWLAGRPGTAGLPIGYFGASTGAAAALAAAADDRVDIAAVVSRGGRPDLAGARLADVTAPTLLIVGARDEAVLELNRQAQAAMTAVSELSVIDGATHLFEEPGTLEQAAARARDWFTRHLIPAT